MELPDCNIEDPSSNQLLEFNSSKFISFGVLQPPLKRGFFVGEHYASSPLLKIKNLSGHLTDKIAEHYYHIDELEDVKEIQESIFDGVGKYKVQ